MNSFLSYLKSLGAFSGGVFVGVCYGSIIATATSYFILSALGYCV